MTGCGWNRGAACQSDYLSHCVRRIRKRALRMSVSPDIFRGSAATTLLRISPEHARLVRPILALAGFETVERHCIHARAIEVGRGYADLVDTVRRA